MPSVQRTSAESRFRRPLKLLGAVAGAALLAQAVLVVNVRPIELIAGIGNMVALFLEALPPDLETVRPALAAALETLDIALVATAASVVLSLPISALAAANVAPHRAVYTLVRTLAALSRAIPNLVWALFFVVAVGLGPFAGVLALTVHSVGMLVRLFGETIEEMDTGTMEALVTAGATRVQVMSHAVVPQITPTLAGLRRVIR